MTSKSKKKAPLHKNGLTLYPVQVLVALTLYATTPKKAEKLARKLLNQVAERGGVTHGYTEGMAVNWRAEERTVAEAASFKVVEVFAG